MSASGIHPGHVIPPRMTVEELLQHKAAIQRQAIPFFKGKGCFDGEPRRKRWSMCVRMVAETWMMMGPQLDNVPGTPICLPEKQ